jgi:dTDP-glucose 4,6-dehydratase
MKHILLTGTAGFIGSNFVPYFLEKYQNYKLISLDNLTYAGNLENLKEVIEHPRHVFVEGSITNRNLIQNLFDTYPIEGVIHFAAESHVDNSIKNPGVFIETNVTGTFTLLDVAYKNWMDGPFKYKKQFQPPSFLHPESPSRHSERSEESPQLSTRPFAHAQGDVENCHLESPSRHSERSEESTPNTNTDSSPLAQNDENEYTLPRFHHISTDEVYGSLGDTGLFTESTPYAPNSPYSASKAASDMIVRSYHHTYGLNTVITNCSNNYGPKQHDEKLIPTIIRNALQGNPIPIYGDGKNIRDWLYVLDHCKGIDLAFHQGKSGETYNIGGRNERTNLQIVHTICELLDETTPLTRHSERSEESTPNTNTDSSPLAQNDVNKKSYKDLITFVQDRAGHDRRYAIDATKIETELGWRADEDFESGIVKTIQWYLSKHKKA